MLGTIESVKERVGNDFQQRDRFYPDALYEMEAWDSPISIMFRYWLDLRQGTDIGPIRRWSPICSR